MKNANQRSRCGFWIVLGLLSASRMQAGEPPADADKLPPGYVEFTDGDVSYYCRPEHRELAKTLTPKIHAYRATVRAKSNAFHQKTEKATENLKGWMDQWTHLDRDRLEKARGEVDRILSGILGERKEERWKTASIFSDLISGMSKSASLMSEWGEVTLRYFLAERVKLVTVREVKDGRVPGLTFDPAEQHYNFNVEFKISSGSAPGMAAGTDDKKNTIVVPLTPWNMAASILVDDPDRPPEKLLKLMEDIVEGIVVARLSDLMPGSTRVEKGLEKADGLFLVLHEYAEISLMLELDIRDPLARWFHDGAANAIAGEAIRRTCGQAAAPPMPYDAKDIERYLKLKPRVNLLAWPRADLANIDPSPTDPEWVHAHYAWATHEVRGFAERIGWENFGEFLKRLKAKAPVSTPKILQAASEDWKDDLPARLTAYGPRDPLPAPALAELAWTADSEKDVAGLLTLAERLVAISPRTPEGHYYLGLANAYLHGDEGIGRTLREWRIWQALLSLCEVTQFNFSTNLGNEKCLYSIGRFYEESVSEEAAVTPYERALKFNPDYAPARERLEKLKIRLVAPRRDACDGSR